MALTPSLKELLMNTRLPLAAVLAMAAAAVFSASAAAQTPTQDSLTITGTAGDPGFRYADIDIHAFSGPSGEAPGGRAFLVVTSPGPGNIAVGSRSVDNVTCLAISGNHAVTVFRDVIFGLFVVEAADNGPPDSGLDQFNALPADPSRSPSDCTPLGLRPGVMTSGDVAIRDVPALPTTKDQCKNGGWRAYGVFKNQGDCVSFVATKGKNQPGQ
jgi:hypothetical protein